MACSLATGFVVLVATGGLAAATTTAPVRHLLAIGPDDVAAWSANDDRRPGHYYRPRSRASFRSAPVQGPPEWRSTHLSPSSCPGPPAPGAPVPTLDAPIPGQWSVNGTTLTFIPTGRYQPWSKEEVTVPAGLADSRNGELQHRWRPRPAQPAITG